ncbi:MAG TPA: dihydrodipicolinate synthase family protein [Acidimicrobiia bacterium]|nr:dihydrodipicolinate synthase family protein [Acidimicrobiia bacterium]
MRTPPRVMPALITPFGLEGRLDLAAHHDNVGRLWERGVAGLAIGGSNGEGPYLEAGERHALAAVARRAAPEAFILVGIAAESLRAAIEMAAEAGRAGADALLVMTPTTLVRHRPDLLEAYYRDLAGQAELPIFLYSVPKVTAVELSLDAAVRLSQVPGIVGMKDSGGDAVKIATLASQAKRGFYAFAGSSAAISPSMATGPVYGALTASVNYAPELVAALVAAAGSDVTQGLHDRLVRLSGAIEQHGVTAVKYAAERTGLSGGWPRLPLRPATAEVRAAVDAAIAEAGVPTR